MLSEFDVKDRKVLITGAGRGIGRGIALVLAEAGADVGVTSLGAESSRKVAEEIKALGRKGYGWAGDGTKVADTEALFKKVLADMGGVDVLINCLGDAIRGPVVPVAGSKPPAISEADWHKVMDINLTQAFVGCRVFGPSVIAAKGNIINISGFAAIRPEPTSPAYSAAKAGLGRFTEALALELAPHKVRVNAIAPGYFPDYDLMTPGERETRKAQASQSVPLGRPGLVRDVGLMALFLASDAASFVTGQTFTIDGGRTL